MGCLNYFEHHLTLLKALYQHCQQQPPFAGDQGSDVDHEFLEQLKTISEAKSFDDEFQTIGQTLIARIVGHYSHITPTVNRDLFWFFAGECLHYMADEELSQYQQLDELLGESNDRSISYAEAKATVFKLH